MSVISIQDLKLQNINTIFHYANNYKKYKNYDNILKNKLIGFMFLEPSSRTQMSFEAAIKLLGGNTLELNINNSSLNKGECIEDTIKCIESYCDLIIIRQKFNLNKIKDVFNKPLINAGDGSNEHPTQALIDLYTIKQNFKDLTNKVITIVGDIKYSRTVHSLVKLLSLYNITINLLTIKELQIDKDYFKNYNNINFYNNESLEQVIKLTDILYVTRIQKERFNSNDFVKNLQKEYVINKNTIKNSKDTLIILHPLPRNNELSKDLDNDIRSKYFDQMNNGLFVRMGLLKYLFE